METIACLIDNDCTCGDHYTAQTWCEHVGYDRQFKAKLTRKDKEEAMEHLTSLLEDLGLKPKWIDACKETK
jgi:hypothetical protein